MNTTHPEGHGPDWADSLPDEGPTCRCGFNGTPEECASFRRAASSDTERDERLRRSRAHESELRRRVERNLADIMDSEAGRRCVSCAHLKHNHLGYCQVGQCSCAIGTSLAGTAGVVLRDASILLDRQAAEVARLEEALRNYEP